MTSGPPSTPAEVRRNPPFWSISSPWPTLAYLIALVLALLMLNDSKRLNPASRPIPLSEASQLRQIQGEKKLTAQDQYLDRAAVVQTESIKQKIHADPALSAKAKRAVVVSSEESVTLRGAVRSESEKRRIGQYAENATNKRVNNELIIQ